jgi:ribosome-associated translation inhibitor RaiA
MTIQIRARGLKLTKAQRTRLERRLAFVFARFGRRIDRVIVRLSDAEDPPGYWRCQLGVVFDAETVRAEQSDIDIFLALEHAAGRAARSVSRAIEMQSLVR